jgi:hypothetical protein
MAQSKILKIVLTNPEPNESKEQICLHNLSITDEYYNLKLFSLSVTAWFKLNPEKNYQDLEKYLRDNKLNTHLICKKPSNISKNHKLGLFKENDSTLYLYECIYSCRPPPYALLELKETMGFSYEENFENLKFAGSIFVEDEETDQILKNKNIKKLNSQELNIGELISICSKKINIIQQ